jgi:hypothetical protein
MSRFRNELRVIPRPAWVVVWVLFLVSALVITAGAIYNWSFAVLCALPIAALFGVYVLLIGYVYGDSRRRGMPHILWTLLATFIPNGIGIILYFVLRDRLQLPCPSCGAGCKAGLAYCPNCGARMSRQCPDCKYPLEESWKNCGHCGVALPL